MITISEKLRERLIKGLKKHIPITLHAQAVEKSSEEISVISQNIFYDLFGFPKRSIIKNNSFTYSISLNANNTAFVVCCDAATDLLNITSEYCQEHKWLIYTNGAVFKIYKSDTEKCILIHELDILNIYYKSKSELNVLYPLCVEAFSDLGCCCLDQLYVQLLYLNKHTIAQILLKKSVVDQIRREVHRIFPFTSITTAQLTKIVKSDILNQNIINCSESNISLEFLSNMGCENDEHTGN